MHVQNAFDIGDSDILNQIEATVQSRETVPFGGYMLMNSKG